MIQPLNRLLAIVLTVLLCANLTLPFTSTRPAAEPRLPIRTIPASTSRPLRSPKKKPSQEVARPQGESSTELADGRLLLIGGEGPNGPLSSISVNDTRTGETSVLTNLQHGRAWHSASILPDGRVLVFGGIGYGNRVIAAPEVIDLESRRVERIKDDGLTARAHHTATLLTDGSVLLVGGTNKNTTLADAQLWDPKTYAITMVAGSLGTPRQKHKATLQQDGSVLIEDGIDQTEKESKIKELFDVNSRTFAVTSGYPESQDTYLAASMPAPGSANVPIDSTIALRFSRAVRAGWANGSSITLSGPNGIVDSKVVPCERGKLVFVTPKTFLQPDTNYSLSIADTNTGTNAIAATSISFRTNSSASTVPPEGEEWIPNDKNFNGDWRSNRAESPLQKLPALQAEAGATAVAGQILLLNGNALPNVTLTIGSAKTVTDHSGRFLLTAFAGHQVLLVDGRTANKPNKSYGVFKIGVDVVDGRTNALPFVIWMPKLDTANAVTFESPTNRETVIKTPYIPNLELHIPYGTVIRGLEDQIVNQVSITPIPIDRPPYPLPAGLNVPVFFTIQPGGARVIPPRAQIYYPNYSNSKPGTRVSFWRYDPEGKGWYIYGQGSVSANGKQVIPDPGVVIYEFGGFMDDTSVAGKYNDHHPATGSGDDDSGGADPHGGSGSGSGSGSRGRSGGPGSPPASGGSGGDPVDVSSGLFTLTRTDLSVADVIPITLTRTYRPGDSFSRGFGIGTRFLYDMQLWSAQNYQEADLVLPTGAPIHYVRISPGTGWVDAVYEHTSTPTSFYKSRISWNGNGWDLKFADGTVYVMGEIAPLQAIKDRYGNKLTITRTSGQTGNITQITSPSGRWVQFTYDTSKRITQARDNIGRTVNYTYDTGGRLWKVTDPGGGVTEYTYDIANQMLTMKDARGIVCLTNEYDANGRVRKQTLADDTPANPADNPTYQFSYVLDGNGKVTQTDVTDPRNNITRVTFNADGYPLVHTYAAGRPEQQSITYERQAGSNIILSTTDHLGRKTTYAREAMGYITEITVLADTPNAVSAQFSYDPTFHLPATATDPLNREVSFAYDANGSVTSINAPLGQNYTFKSSSSGQLLQATDPLNNTYQFGYDGFDLISVTDPLNRTFTRFTDAVGRTLSVKNATGQVVRYQLDALDQLTSIKNPLLGVSSFSYNANGNVLSISDPRGNPTTYTYDNSNRPVTRRDPLLHDDQFHYNLDGTLQQIIDRNGQVTSFSYDAIGRLTGITYADASTVTYTYDSANNITQVTDSISGVVTLAYDNLDRLTQKTTPQGVISYTYDAVGRRATMTVANQPVVSYTYDDAGRLTQITQGTNTISFGYDVASRRTSLTFPNGVITEYSYDAASQLIGLTYKRGPNVLGNLTYTYDSNGRRTGVGGSFARTSLPSTVNSATYDQANRQNVFGGQSLAFDTNGSLTSDGSNTYSWDARNQLVSISGPSLTASFQYDSFGRRISKTVNGVSTSYLYDGANLVQEQSNGQVSANLLSGALDEVFVRTDSSGATTALTDALGSTIALTDAYGTIQTEYTYSPFGETIATGAANSNSLQYTGRENDATGLHYYRARYYSPSLHRFISEDPIGLAGGPNLYGYVRNSPTNLTDPFGLDPDSDPLGGLIRATKFGLLAVVLGIDLMVMLAMSSGPAGPGMGAGGPLGDLTAEEIAQIQKVVNQAGRPLEVVGSAARGARTVGSDIDYVVTPGSLPFYENRGLQNQLPGIDPGGLIPGAHNPYMGPAVRFEPGVAPTYVAGKTP